MKEEKESFDELERALNFPMAIQLHAERSESRRSRDWLTADIRPFSMERGIEEEHRGGRNLALLHQNRFSTRKRISLRRGLSLGP